MAFEVVVEHLNHLGIVAELCREIGVAEWLDAQNAGSRQQVSVGTATVAMVLNGLGLSNRQLYLVPQFFDDKSVEHLLGPGVTAADLNDDCLGRTLDWLYAHDVTTLFAGLALRARRAFGVPLTRLHADTTSFAVSGAYTPVEGDLDAHTIAVTYGYSRDHRENLKQWMLALVTSQDGVPQFLKPLDGNASDKVALPQVVMELTRQLRASEETAGVYVADSGLYSEANMRALGEAGVAWVSRVPETSSLAQALIREESTVWQQSEDERLSWWGRTLELPQGQERWLVVRSAEGEQRARATLQRQVEREQAKWEKRWWHLSHRPFACAPDAQAALEQERQQLPPWLVVQTAVVVVPKYGRAGRPRQDAQPIEQEWHVQGQLELDPDAVEREVRRKAAFLIATNVLEVAVLPDRELIQTYNPHSAVWIDPKARFLVGWTPCPAQPYLSGMGRTLGDLMASRYVVEHLHHLGIVAEVCREIGVANWLDQQEPGNRQQVSVGTATVAMVLNGLGFSNRRLYLVPQFFADKPVEHLLGPGIMAEDLNDDCLGRTLDWLYAHDVTRLFAGLALRARRAFGIEVGRLHADTTSFAVHGQYALDLPEGLETPEALTAAAQSGTAGAAAGDEDEEDTGAPTVIEVTDGYSRDHRADLKQWMLALVTSGEGVPQFLQPLDGNASDKRTLLEAVQALTQQLKASGETPGVYVADSGLYGAENMTRLNATGVHWVSRVPETATAAQTIVQERLAILDGWHSSHDGTRQWWSREEPDLAQGRERWIVVRTQEGQERARATVQRQAERDQQTWEKRLWHLGNQTFACAPDAQAALARACQRLPPWFVVVSAAVAQVGYAARGRPRKDAAPSPQGWQIQATLTRDPIALEREALRRAAFIVATNLLDTDAWPDEAVIALYREQTVVERGFAFLKDPLFLASSVFVKRPERIMALAFVMTLCLLVYKLAEVRLRHRLAQTGQTVPDQKGKPTARPTLRWLFQVFEGIDLHHTLHPGGTRATEVLRLTKVHRLVLRLLGPAYENCYLTFQETAE